MAPRIDIPEGIKRYAPEVSARLVAGTFTMGASETMELYGQSVVDHTMLYQHYKHAEGAAPYLARIGTLNPASLGPGNQVVCLAIDRPGWKSAIVACWVPDGAAGRYMVEQNPFFIERWHGHGPIARQHKWRLWLAVILHLGWGRFLFRRWIEDAFNNHPKGGNPTAIDRLQLWAADLMRQGKFQAEYARAFASTGGPVIGDSGENAFM